MIKKRNLDESLIHWILSNAGLGPGIGKIRYIAKDSSATQQFRSYLQSMGVLDGDIFDDLQEAHDNCTAYQNDVCILFPGTWDVNLTAHGEDGIAWSKANTHLIAAYPKTQYNAQCRIASQGTTGVNFTMTVTTKESVFSGFNVTNSHSATGVGAVVLGDGATVASLNNYFKNVGMAGIHGASALSSATAFSLQMYGAASTFFENCQIGDTISNKTASSGQLRFTAVTNGIGNQNNTFKDCTLQSWSNTAGSYIVLNDGANAMDRLTYFDNCCFFNFDNGGGMASAVFHMPAGTPTGYHVSLHNCINIGSTAWASATSVATNLTIDMPVANAAGGTDTNAT